MKDDTNSAGALRTQEAAGDSPKHTPGPWVIRSDGETLQLLIMTADEKTEVATINFDYHPEDDEPVAIRKKADARLIASAPSVAAAAGEMLAALKAMVRDWEPENDGGVYRRHWEEAHEAITAAHRAGIRTQEGNDE